MGSILRGTGFLEKELAELLTFVSDDTSRNKSKEPKVKLGNNIEGVTKNQRRAADNKVISIFATVLGRSPAYLVSENNEACYSLWGKMRPDPWLLAIKAAVNWSGYYKGGSFFRQAQLLEKMTNLLILPLIFLHRRFL